MGGARAKSCAHWLSWRLNLEPGTAREQVRVASKLAALPLLDEELKHARVTYSQVRAITRVATPENEGRLIELARVSNAAQLERIVRGVRQVNALAYGAGGRPGGLERWVRVRPMGDGTARVEAQLCVDEAALLMEALQAMCAQMRAEQRVAPQREGEASEGEARVPKPSYADALVRMAEEVEARERSAPEASRTGAERTSLVVHFGPDLVARGTVRGAGPPVTTLVGVRAHMRQCSRVVRDPRPPRSAVYHRWSWGNPGCSRCPRADRRD